jgi:signal transduction histidine kinase
VGEVRRLVYQLRPAALDNLGLSSALEQEGRRLVGDVHLAIESSPEPLPDLPAAVEVAAYRIVMEALTNIGRHAKANRCRVLLEAGKSLIVEIEDDGVGFSAETKPGVGLASMRERAAELGGEFFMAANDNGGTILRAVLPC